MHVGHEHNGYEVSLNIHNHGSADYYSKIAKAAKHVALAVSSDEFKEFCHTFSYSYRSCRGALWWKKCRRVTVDNFNWNKGLTRDAIYKRIMDAKEKHSASADQKADIELVIDYSDKRGVLGYTYPNSVKQWIYSWYVRDYDYTHIAGNIFHEHLHKLGFDHAFKYHYTRQFTVPYACGNFVRKFQA